MRPILQNALAIFVSLLFASTSLHAQLANETKPLYPNFDIRENTSTTAARAGALSTNAPQAMSAARTALSAKIPSLQIEMNRFGTAPEAIGTTNAQEFLTAESSRPRAEVAHDFLQQNAAVFGLTSEQISALVPIADYANPAGNMSWIEYRQEANGIPFFQGEIHFAFTGRGALAHATGNLVPALDYSTLPTTAKLSADEAARSGAATIGVKLSAAKLADTTPAPLVRPIQPTLLYFPLAPGVAKLAYTMTLWQKPESFTVIVDANDGTLLWRKNITNYQTQTATYSVYTDDSPSPWSPSGTLPGQGLQPPAISRTTVTLIGNEAPNTFNNLGWMTDGVNTTTGNNVDCGLDISSPNGIDTGGRAVGSPNRVFNFNYNPAPGGTDQPTTTNSRNGAITNLFYWTNVYHDRLYLLGFTEAARNFQTNNFSRGGSGNDAVSAQVQDYSGTNNANFSTPADGSPGQMQMYLFTGPTPQRDGALDGEVFLHEMTHGLSNRLHNNGSGLATQISGGMGEGWSDYYARCLLSSADEDVNGIFASGGYVTYLLSPGFTDNYYYGIRRFPYAVKSNVGANGKPHNPMTFADIDFAQINALNDGAYPSSPVIGITANEVHNIGAIWCQMLLEARARMITRLGWATGNQRALQIVTDAMKLDVASPTIVQARDTIIQADNAGFAGDDVPDIRSGFATRGVGAGATVTGSTYLTVVESYYPSSAPGAITFNDSLGNNNGFAEAGEDLIFTIPLTNRLTTTDTNVAAKLGNYSVSYGSIGTSATVSQTFNYHVPANTACGTTLQIPFVVMSDNGVANVTIPLTIGAPTTTVSFSENFDGVTAPALPSGWTTSTSSGTSNNWKTVASPVIDAGNCAFVSDLSTAADSSLTSPTIAIPAGNSQLSFKQRYTTELGYDAGVLEISINGSAFTDIQTAGGFFVQGGYGATIGSAIGTSLASRRTWSGSVTTTSSVVVNLPAAASGQNAQLRWHFASDANSGSTGWYIDTVQVSSTSYNCASIDSDGDGIPDGYEIAHGLNPNDPNDAALDSDGDGLSNLQEYLAGTNPQSAASALRITATTANPANGSVTIAFPSVDGKTYSVEWTNDLSASWNILQPNIVGTGGTLSANDASASGQPLRFYRVRAMP